jgi:hypothetical protein
MTRYHFGEKGERLKWNFLFLCALIIAIGGSCLICSRTDWSFVQHRAFREHLAELEDEILLGQTSARQRSRKFIARCGQLLRKRWQTAYMYSKETDEGYFIGRIPPRDFRQAVQDQIDAIHKGEPIDEGRIPNLVMVVEFERLNCRLIVGEAPQDQP